MSILSILYRDALLAKTSSTSFLASVIVDSQAKLRQENTRKELSRKELTQTLKRSPLHRLYKDPKDILNFLTISLN